MKIGSCAIALLTCLNLTTAASAPVYQPPGANSTYGDVTHGHWALSATGNPAAAAADLQRQSSKAKSSMTFSLVAGLEYGNLQDLFDVIDEASKPIEPSPPDPGAPPSEKPPGGIDLDEILDLLDPETKAIIAEVAEEIGVQATLLAIISVEGYAKGFYSADIPVAFSKERLGGAWTLGFNYSAGSKAAGVSDPIDFDSDQALINLENGITDLDPDSDDMTTIDLTGGAILKVTPSSGKLSLRLNNDSLLLTKSAIISELSTGYSRELLNRPTGSLFLGAKAKFYHVQLSRLSTRFGDITDSEELWKAIRDSEFRDSQGLGLDFGALWLTRRYSVGASLTNINEPSFRYPSVDTSNYTTPEIINFLAQDERYTIERQFKLEASVFTAKRRWTANFGIDANAIKDPFGDKFQWLTLSGGYTMNSFWLPNIRLGYRKNLAGTEISYVGFGLTAFKYFNLDLASSLDTTRINGDKLPRGLSLSLGFNINF